MAVPAAEGGRLQGAETARQEGGRLSYLVDIKVVAGVDRFDGQDIHWRSFSREFVVAVSNLGMDELMALVNDGSTVEADLYGRVLSDDLKLMSKGLYILLNDRVSGGKAKDIMEAVPANEGFVAWRKLKEEYEKDDPSRFNAMLNGLINPKFEEVMQNTGHSFKDVMREWENAVHRCKKQSKQQFPENMMISVIQTHGTAEVKGLLRLNAANIGNSWDRARAVLDSYIAAGTTYSMAGVPVNPSSNDGVAPMDIGGVHGQPYGQRP